MIVLSVYICELGRLTQFTEEAYKLKPVHPPISGNEDPIMPGELFVSHLILALHIFQHLTAVCDCVSF